MQSTDIHSGQNAAASSPIGVGNLIVNSGAMSNHVPLHIFEIVFYSTAALLTAIGVVLVWLH
jgi:hypothetical protein